jgi:hypothetical protein
MYKERIIGGNEKITDEEFNRRRIFEKPNYNNFKCPSVIIKDGKLEPLNYELAELKSSLLIQNLINNDIVNLQLVNFLNNILNNILNSYALINYIDNILLKYINLIPTSTQGDNNIYSYPVSQIKKFNNPESIKKDFLALYNFIRYLISNINIEKDLVLFKLTIQKIMNIQSIARGDRFIDQPIQPKKPKKEDYTNSEIYEEVLEKYKKKLERYETSLKIYYKDNTDNVGITNIVPEPNYLKRKVRHEPDINNEPWFHPGRGRCNFSHMGLYSEILGNYKKNNNFYGSIQCGISASTNFVIMMYLISLLSYTNSKTDSELKDDVNNIILTATIVLLGDGGHNIRETVTGITIMAISLKLYLENIKNELKKQYKINFDLNEHFVNDEPTTKQPFLRKIWKQIQIQIETNTSITDDIMTYYKYIINAFGKWEKFINILYEQTKTINPLGFTKENMNELYMGEAEHSKTIMMRDIMFKNVEPTLINRNDYNFVVIALSLDSDRYKLTDFRNKYYKFFKNIVENIVYNNKKIGDEIIKLTNEQMNEIINKCNNEVYNKLNINKKGEDIPFAFTDRLNSSKSNLRKKSIRRSRTKSKSIRKSSKSNLGKKSIRKSSKSNLRKKSIKRSKSKSNLRKKSIRKSSKSNLRKKSIKRSKSKSNLRKKSIRRIKK